MRIEVVGIEHGSCNECSKGRLKENRQGLTYPYRKVYQILIGMNNIRLCGECFEDLKKLITQKHTEAKE